DNDAYYLTDVVVRVPFTAGPREVVVEVQDRPEPDPGGGRAGEGQAAALPPAQQGEPAAVGVDRRTPGGRPHDEDTELLGLTGPRTEKAPDPRRTRGSGA
ncbi:hypothetical protein, partial [Streptomyces xanthophaeus]|uniref:hypothetical protein n=1 Tax=Streptomyces xanthophaeus TaxID=67385 RepID=UPI00364E2F26